MGLGERVGAISPMRLQTIVILIFTLAGFALRLHYLTTTHPFFDEYTTVLAARQILQQGWPILPSGLFYEHGLLATYLTTPFTALFIDAPLSQWQPAHWGLMLARWPSLLIGTATIPLIYTLGQRGFNAQPGQVTPAPLLAAGLFALSPEGMVWGGRTRMYALATLLVLLAVYWAYRGAIYPAPAKYRWWALLALLATLLTQFGAIMLIPPLVISMLVVGWLSHRMANGEWRMANGERRINTQHATRNTQHATRNTQHVSRFWSLRPAVLLEAAALATVIGLAILIKRLGRPLGVEALSHSAENSHPLADLFNNTVAYQTTFYFTWPDTIKFLSRQFGVPHHFWLTLALLVGGVIGLIFWLSSKKHTTDHNHQSALYPSRNTQHAPRSTPHPFTLFLWLIFGLIIIEMVTLLEPFRRNPRYIVMYLPFFYLIAARSINYQLVISNYQLKHFYRFSFLKSPFFNLLASLALLALIITLGFNDLRVALLTPEPAYEEAFARIQADWQPGDTLLTMNTPAAGLYLGHADGFTVQTDADQFLLHTRTAPVDRWLGVPWVGRAADFNAVLNANERVWFVIDTIRQPVYFRGDWQAIVNTQMEQVWAKDNVLIYRTYPDRTPLPTEPGTLINATLGDSIQLVGYAVNNSKFQQPAAQAGETQNSTLALVLFWQPLVPLSIDYTTFLHLRDPNGLVIAQRDGQPVDGAYPTSHWQPGETVIDPITLPLPEGLPAGRYTLFTGLYQLDTLERLPVANDTSGENAILLGEITLP